MSELIEVLIKRDGLSRDEVEDQLRELAERVHYDGDDAEVLLREELGLEPDYLFDLLDFIEDDVCKG